ncbi:MAG: hypothetical protein ACM3PY_19340 [Omnitrophica WOR_2 bacterium]
MTPPMKIGIVGPCAAGKSTLVSGLNKAGISTHHIAQEHSYVPAMWQQITQPDLLIYLDVSYEVSIQRRWCNMTPAEFDDQVKRLTHAMEHADLYIHTDSLNPGQVLDHVLNYLSQNGIRLSADPG